MPTPTRSAPGPRTGTVLALLLGLAAGAVYLAVGYGVLGADHPAGDAYILFRYAENLAAGHGIVFNAGGPRSEGATDFLFLLLLAGGVRLGADVAVAALLLNALGAALAVGLLARLAWSSTGGAAWPRALLCALALSAVLAGGALASYSGFSAMLYSSLVLLLYAIAVEARGRGLLALPVLGLVVALFRPDGVVVAGAFALLGLWPARAARLARPYLGTAAACAAAGLAYFAWRWQYFGLLLPLPLYVKQHAAATGLGGWAEQLPGLLYHARWLTHPLGPVPLLLGIGASLVLLGRRPRGGGRWLVFLLPLALLLAELAVAVQSQNLHWRLQAPVWLVLLYALFALAGRALATSRSRLVRSLVALAAVAAVLPAGAYGARVVRLILDGGGRTYLEAFAPRFGPRTAPETVIALTEAGILPYWSRARVLDVVGLTTPETALRPATLASLEEAGPDMVFFHHAGVLAPAAGDGLDPDGDGIARLTPRELRAWLLPAHRRFLERGAASYEEAGLQTVGYAPVVLTRFLAESAGYEILAVDFKDEGRFLHVYGLRKDWPLRGAALEDLRATLRPEGYRAYLESKARRPGTAGARSGP